MVWQTPTRVDLVTEVVNGLNAEMPGLDAANRRNNVRPVAKILGSALHDIHRYAAWAADQAFILTCDSDQLDRHGAQMKPPVPRKQAARAAGFAAMTTASAATIATGALLARGDGALFRVVAGAVLAAPGSIDVAVMAVDPGPDGNTAAAAALTPQGGLIGAATFVASAGALSGGSDVESDDRYRRRLLFAKAYPEHGGAPADYVRYALSVPGVTRAFVDPLGAGRGTVVIYPLFEETSPTGIGTASDRLRVQQAIDAARPGAALALVRNPTPRVIDVAITGVAPATPEVLNAVEYEVRAAFARLARVAGWSEPHPSMSEFLAQDESFSRSWVWQAAANATGEQRHVVVSPASDVALAPGEMAVIGTISVA